MRPRLPVMSPSLHPRCSEGQRPKNREVTPAEVLANIRDLIIQLNFLSAPLTPAFLPPTTTTMPPGRKPSGLLSYIGQPDQKAIRGDLQLSSLLRDG